MKNLTCIECPKGCSLSVDVENGKIKNVGGAKCPKGIGYAISEVENPVRIFTSTVLAEGLELKLVPVRTEKPIPRQCLLKASEEVRKLRISRALKVGDTVAENFLGLGVNLVSTREVLDMPGG
jgi:CxxC motif-containing protein